MAYQKKKIGFRPTWAEVDLSALKYNFRRVKKAVVPGIKIMATIKADAYGHGLIPVGKVLAQEGVDCFGVASIDEGIILRAAGITTPIVVLGLILKEDIEPLFIYRLTPTVSSYDFAFVLEKKARALKQKIPIHIKVDTGMGRIGVEHAEAVQLIKKIRCLPFLVIEGVFTHFAFADLDREFTGYQIRLFNSLIVQLEREGTRIPLIHAANSMGLLSYKQSHFTMVRPGLVLYGLHPTEKLTIRFKPVLSLKTKAVYVKRVAKGTGISYGHLYVTPRKTTIVTLPIGYGDGYPRNLSNVGPVLIGGKRFTICGQICMDQIMVDVGNTHVQSGDEAVLIGSQKNARITVEGLAALAGTIPYEIVCGLGSRIPRVYLPT